MPRTRHTVQVTTEEKFVLLMLRSAPPVARALAIDGLVRAVVEPLQHERLSTSNRFTAAARSLRISSKVATVKGITGIATSSRALILGGGR